MSLYYKQRWYIVFLCEDSNGPKISRQECANKLKISKSSVSMWIKRYRETGTVDDIPKAGRPRLTTKKQDERIVQVASSLECHSATEIAKKVTRFKVHVSPRTITRRVTEKGMVYGSTLAKPLLSAKNRKKRLEWTKNLLADSWDNVVFTDEATFRIYGVKKKVWRFKNHKIITRIVKHPAKVHVWGCFSNKGFGKLYCFKSNLNGPLLTKIYSKALVPSAKAWFGKNTSKWTLQEDNDPKHRSKISTAWKCSNGITTLDWPSQSPDLNPIENVWAFMKHKLKKNPVDSVDSLVRRLRSIWNSLSKDYAKNLVNSMPKRLEAVVLSKGDWTVY